VWYFDNKSRSDRASTGGGGFESDSCLVMESDSRVIGEMSWHHRSVSDDSESFEDCGQAHT